MKTILFIDDNTEMLENTSELLELSNYKVYTASNGKDGIKLAKKEKPNLIICDVMMPGIDGYEVLHMLSQDPVVQQIPFIFLTAKSGKNDFRNGMNLGADDYITKPFEEMDLLRTIERRLAKSNGRIAVNLNDSNFNIEELLEGKQEKVYKKKEKVFYDGERPNWVYYVKSGKIKTWKMDSYGKELITGVYGAGDVFGYTSILENSNYLHSANTIEDTCLVAIPRSEFEELMANNSSASAFFLKELSNRVVSKNKQLLKIAYGSLRERVAQTLLDLSEKSLKYYDSNIIKYTREDLAHIVGTASESLIRILKELKEDKMIVVEKSNIEIINKQALEKLAAN